MPDSPPVKPQRLRRFFIAGILTLIPLWITWLIVAFLFRTLSAAGEPIVRWLASVTGWHVPLLEPLVSFVLIIVVIFLLGVLSSFVLGRQLVNLFEALVGRVPFVKSVYGSVKKLTNVLQEKPPGDLQRVVLIDFPSREMKTVGLVTRVLVDDNTGRKLAAVYVPTTPNPTSGYLEIVPVERLTPTDWTMDEAMSFIVSGGAIAPKTMVYDRPQADERSL